MPQDSPPQTVKPSWTEVHKRELLNFVKGFYRASYDWRRQSYHTTWDKCERNYRQIYDPTDKAKKEPWQATMFIPATPSNVEIISSSLTKIASATKHPIAVEPREMGDELQAELNNELIDYYVEKGDYVLNRSKVLKEATIFGSGFMKIFQEQKFALRRMNEPVLEGFEAALKKGRAPGTVLGQKSVKKRVMVRDCIKYQPVHIRDIFLEPNSIDGQRIIHREKITYGEIKSMADRGFFDKEQVKELYFHKESDNFEEDIALVKYDQGITDNPGTPKPSYDQKHTIWEYWGPLPAKWLKYDMPEDTEAQRMSAEELIPGRAVVASGNFLLGSEENMEQSMEPPFVQMDYINTNQTYGLGVAQLMMGLQAELNEIRNLRVDNVNLVMQKVFMVIEKYIVEPKELRMSPGAVIRLKGSEIDDIKKVLAELPVSDVPISAFRETSDIERQIQEVTAANRVTLGTAGMTRDSNQTLGGMELLRQAAMDRFIVYAYLIGRQFDVKAAKKTVELIYQHMTPEKARMILGEMPVEYLPGDVRARWTLWRPIPPHEMDVCYNFVPVDVFATENKFQKSQDLMSKGQFLASVIPGWNPRNLIKRLFKYSEFSNEEVTDILSGLPPEDVSMPTPMGMGQGVPSISRPTRQGAGEMSPMPASGGPNGMPMVPQGAMGG